jgi:hypothetical protein
MYLLSWALQEEVLRNPGLSRNARLEKAILGFELLMHSFNLWCLPHDCDVSQRFYSKTTQALTFTEEACWLRVLNSTLILLDFVISGDENCSFSKLGTHCLEHFFGLVRQSSRSDDRFTCTIGIISRATVMVGVMRDLSLHRSIRGRDNVGGTIIGKGWATFSAYLVSTLCHSFIAQACLHYDPPDPSILYDRDGLIAVLTERCQNDNHHKDDPDHRADFTGKIARHAIIARNLRRGSSGDDSEPVEIRPEDAWLFVQACDLALWPAGTGGQDLS